MCIHICSHIQTCCLCKCSSVKQCLACSPHTWEVMGFQYLVEQRWKSFIHVPCSPSCQWVSPNSQYPDHSWGLCPTSQLFVWSFSWVSFNFVLCLTALLPTLLISQISLFYVFFKPHIYVLQTAKTNISTVHMMETPYKSIDLVGIVEKRQSGSQY